MFLTQWYYTVVWSVQCFLHIDIFIVFLFLLFPVCTTNIPLHLLNQRTQPNCWVSIRPRFCFSCRPRLVRICSLSFHRSLLIIVARFKRYFSLRGDLFLLCLGSRMMWVVMSNVESDTQRDVDYFVWGVWPCPWVSRWFWPKSHVRAMTGISSRGIPID